MSFLHLFGSLLHYPHPTQQPVEEEGRIISRRLRELLDETDHRGEWRYPSSTGMTYPKSEIRNKDCGRDSSGLD